MTDNTAFFSNAAGRSGTANDQASSVARLEQLEAELTRTRVAFAALNNRLSHEVQGVLRNVAGFASYIRDTAHERLTAREVQYLGRIEAAAQRGANVARDLSSLATVSTSEMRRTAVDPAKLAAQTVRDLHPALEGRCVRFDIPQGPGPRAHADPVLVQLAMWHLLSNAVKFTQPVGDASIRVAVREAQDSCVITVTDNGVGFSEEYAHKLFSPFERLHHESEFEGSGIGLAVVKEIALRHGGSVGAELAPGSGARFWIALPLAGAVGPAGAPEAAACVGRAARRLVVAIDDEPLVLMTVKTLLERDGNEVITALGGMEGLRLMKSLARDGRKVDVVISDWLMPRVSGAEIARAAKELHPASRVILLTGARADASANDDASGIVDSIVSKPVRAPELRRIVAQARSS